ncbi:ABL interactor-like protein 2 [Euphorbia peplus]|nr:ABL interactor-like protein 2 [Euphorbia peplus]
MDSKNSSSSNSVCGPQQGSNNQDEIYMHQTLLFSDTLQELKSLRKQLDSAAEYFETCYSGEDQKQIVVESLKDYAIKALINTIDHLGSVAYKVNNFVDEKVGEVSALELRFCCLQQRVQTCQKYIDQGGVSEQVLMIGNPKHHKRYIFPDEETLDFKSKHHRSFNSEINSNQFKNVVQATIKATSPSVLRERNNHISQSPQFYSRQRTFALTSTPPINRRPDKKAASPKRFPFIRSGSVLKRSVSPNYPETIRRNPSEAQRSVSLSKFSERKGANDSEQYSSKSKRLFKALISMRKTRKDQNLYKYLDEV